MGKTVNAQWLGRVSYEAGLQLQSDLVELKAADPNAEDRLFLLEHDPVYTVGRSVSLTDPEFSGLPHPVLQINRGGKITFHGPGQLVGYPVLDLRTRGQDLHRHLRLMEEGLVEVARLAGVRAQTREGLTGVWCGDRKLASIGVGVRRWVTMHGFALNVCGALEGFEHITPCGLTGVKVTSLEREGACLLDVRAVAALAADVFLGVL
ncbi:MAG: lipoyl(octanoyl) transferase [Verrucomicrobia bacterium]|nr:MAG: lipoyl(octanoyl) transferase [Verrucomicrobiota bacterium]